MALITTIAELKKYIAIDANAKIATYLPFINEAENLYIVPLLGREFYAEFLALYISSVDPSPTDLSDDNKALLPYIQRALAYYMQLLALPQLSVTFGDMGVRQHRGEDSDPAPKWLNEKLQLNALKNGDLNADLLLQFLEDTATNAVYATWFASTSNTKNSGYIIYGTAVANKYINISNSRRVFLSLRNKIREIETRMVPKLISKSQYDDLVVNLKANSLSDVYKALLEKLEPIICKRALHLQLPLMRVSIQQDGLWLYSETSLDIRDRWFLAEKEAIEEYREQLEGECDEQYNFGFKGDESELRQFILDNIADYPLIQASGVYTTQPDPGPTWTTKNDINNKHFGV